MVFRQEIAGSVIKAGLSKVEIEVDMKYYQEFYDRIISKQTEAAGFEAYQKAALEKIHHPTGKFMIR